MQKLFVKALPDGESFEREDLIMNIQQPLTRAWTTLWPVSEYAADVQQRLRKAKLYLVTTDIQIGDIVKERLTTGEWEDFEIHTIHDIDKEHQVKVLAELSKEAIWLNDGDTVWEQDVKFSEHPQCPRCGAITNDGFCPMEQDCQIEKRRTVAYVKGPCGHYH